MLAPVSLPISPTAFYSEQFHNLLHRQLRRHNVDPASLPAGFLQAVNEAYLEADRDREMLERSLELTSQELVATNQSLRQINEALEERVRQRTAQLAESNEALRQSEQRFRGVVENARDIILTLSPEGVIDSVNPVVSEILGWRPAELVGKFFVDLLRPEQQLKAYQYISTISQQDGPQSIEANVRTKAGGEVILEIRVTRLKRDGITVGLMSIARDITARKQIERESQKLLTLINNSSDFIGIATLDGQVVSLNPAGKKLVGLPKSTPVQQTRTVDYFSDSDLPTFRNKIMPAVLKKGHWQGEFRFKHFTSGEIIPIQFNVFLLHDPQTNQAIGYGTVSQDIRQHKKIEAELQNQRDFAVQIMASMGQGLALTQINGQLEYVNLALAQMLGYSPEEMVGRNVRDFSVENDTTLIDLAIQQRLKGQTSSYEINLKRANNQFIPALVTGVPRYQDGQIIGSVSVITDLTRQKQIETELRRQKEQFEMLVTVARATSEQSELQATLQNALDVATMLTRAERGSLFLFDENKIVTHHLITGHGVRSQERVQRIRRVMDEGLTGWVVRHGQSALIRDAEHDDRWVRFPGDSYHPRSILAVPIFSGATLVSQLNLFHREVGFFGEDDLRLLEAAADQMALALRNAQVFEAQSTMIDRQTALFELIRAISQQMSEEEVAKAAVEIVSLMTPWEHVCLVLPDVTRQQWVVRAGSGWLRVMVGQANVIRPEILQRILAIQQIHYLRDTALQPNHIPFHPQAQAELLMPVIHRQQVIGVLCIVSPEAYTLDRNDIQLARSIGGAIALGLNNAHLYQTLAQEHGKLNTLVAASRDGIVLIGADQRVLVVNGAALSLLQIPGEANDWIGRPIIESLLPLRHHSTQAVQVAIQEIRRAMKGDELPKEGEYEVSPRFIQWLNIPIKIEGSVPGRLLVLHDVTEERLLEKMRHDLTSTMVHDLRNPITAVMGSLELLQKTNVLASLAPQQRLLDIAVRSTGRALDLVNSILDVSRLESRQMPIEYSLASLYALTQEVLELETSLAANKQITLQNDLTYNLPPIMVDKGLVGRVLQNLIGNAIKFTPTGGRVEIKAQPLPKSPCPAGVVSSAVLLVSVKDNGQGIPPKIKHKLFQKFVTGSQVERGSGLGLAFCRLVLEAHDSCIWVESEPGQGSTFYFTLPIAKEF